MIVHASDDAMGRVPFGVIAIIIVPFAVIAIIIALCSVCCYCHRSCCYRLSHFASPSLIPAVLAIMPPPKQS